MQNTWPCVPHFSQPFNCLFLCHLPFLITLNGCGSGSSQWEAWVWSQATQYGICGGQWHWDVFFPANFITSVISAVILTIDSAVEVNTDRLFSFASVRTQVTMLLSSHLSPYHVPPPLLTVPHCSCVKVIIQTWEERNCPFSVGGFNRTLFHLTNIICHFLVACYYTNCTCQVTCPHVHCKSSGKWQMIFVK